MGSPSPFPLVQERGQVFRIEGLVYNHRFLHAVRFVRGRKWLPREKAWEFPATQPVRRLLSGLGFAFDGDPPTPPPLDIDIPPPLPRIPQVEVPGLLRKLRPFQAEGVSHIEFLGGRVLLADEMGLGKTIQALAWMFYRRTFPAIVVCTATGKSTWERECGITLPGITSHVISGRSPYTLPKADLYIINYQIVSTWVPTLRALRSKCMVLDEAHNIRTMKSVQSKKTREVAKGRRHIIAITGTPVVNRPKDLYPAISMIRPSLFPSWVDFGMNFCAGRHDGYQWNFNGASHSPELNKILTRTLMVRRLKREVAKDLPLKQRVIIPITLSPLQLKTYQLAERDFVAWCRSVGKEIPNQAAGLAKVEALKQLVRDLKMEQVVDWIQDYLYNDEKLVVFATHIKTLDLLQDQFPGSVRLDGAVAGTGKRKAVEQKFQEDSSTRLFLGNLQAAGTTITLTASRTTCHTELGWLPGEHEQAEDRVHRIGQTADAVLAYYFITSDTIEEKLWKLLGLKQEVITQVVDGGAPAETSRGLLSKVVAEYRTYA